MLHVDPRGPALDQQLGRDLGGGLEVVGKTQSPPETGTAAASTAAVASSMARCTALSSTFATTAQMPPSASLRM
jgi:hypothetical protein